jgi:hypothetical protein
MARWIRQNPNANLRAELLAEARELFGGFDAFASYIDQLANGEPVRLDRWELPDDHPERYAGKLSDDLVLGSDDILRLA